MLFLERILCGIKCLPVSQRGKVTDCALSTCYKSPFCVLHKCTLGHKFSLLFVVFFRLEDATLAHSKLQQSLKIKEEKITELDTK